MQMQSYKAPTQCSLGKVPNKVYKNIRTYDLASD